MNDERRIYQIGEAMPRPDAFTKVTGAERFAADRYGENLLRAGVKRAGVPHAIIRSIGTEAALQVPGVVAVLTARDVTGTNRQGVIRKDQPVLADDRVRHCGDAVALVVAVDKIALAAGLDRIILDLEPLPGIFDSEEALKEGAPILHADHPGGNALFSAAIETGDGERAFAACAQIVEARFDLPAQAHVSLETENGWALAGEAGALDIVVSTQTPFRIVWRWPKPSESEWNGSGSSPPIAAALSAERTASPFRASWVLPPCAAPEDRSK